MHTPILSVGRPPTPPPTAPASRELALTEQILEPSLFGGPARLAPLTILQWFITFLGQRLRKGSGCGLQAEICRRPSAHVLVIARIWIIPQHLKSNSPFEHYSRGGWGGGDEILKQHSRHCLRLAHLWTDTPTILESHSNNITWGIVSAFIARRPPTSAKVDPNVSKFCQNCTCVAHFVADLCFSFCQR